MFNNVIITGRLTADPELKVTQSGKNVTSFSIANETGYGENKKVNFLNIIAWQKTAEFVCNYFKKGNMIGIRGEIQTRKWQDKNGNNRIATEIIANDIQFMEKKNDGANAGGDINNACDSGFQLLGDDDELPF